ncbi:hypothetical protein METSCH_A00100 [Metschnikowia aff. pulcherrima]|uniref:Reverse transcriptase domain-containing protein n=1 Tax=Metschnikowia aff. pulcherrima TaxID=2163413 RepID=A0A4V1ADE1_9ASCO|nr:hypothetical protein METSCH_A00100 [Metschnikowia aff. pulcherrima]
MIQAHESLQFHQGFTQQMVKYLHKIVVEDFENFPGFHVLPKMHKSPPSSRPIVPTHSWGTMRISKVLSFMLRPQLEHLPWVILDISIVRDRLREFQMHKDKDYYIMTGDVTSLYTNIPLAAGYQAIREMTVIALRALKPTDLNEVDQRVYEREAALMADTLGTLTKFVMENNYFTSGKRLFRQIQGTAMGTNMAPEFANIYMGVAEKQKLTEVVNMGSCLYLRYIDDVLIIGTKAELDRVAEQEHFLDLPLEVNWEKPAKSLPFLDLQLSISEHSIVYELYRKPINTYQYLEWDSDHPRATKKGFVIGEIVRIFRNCSERATALKHVNFFHQKIRARGYPPRLTNTWIKAAIDSIQERELGHRQAPPAENSALKIFRLKVKYSPSWEIFDAKVLRKRIEQTLIREGILTQGEYPRYSELHVQVSKGRNRNILDFAGSNQKQVLHTHFDRADSIYFPTLSSNPDLEAQFRYHVFWQREDLDLGIRRHAKRARSGRNRRLRPRKRHVRRTVVRRRKRARGNTDPKAPKRLRYQPTLDSLRGVHTS